FMAGCEKVAGSAALVAPLMVCAGSCRQKKSAARTASTGTNRATLLASPATFTARVARNTPFPFSSTFTLVRLVRNSVGLSGWFLECFPCNRAPDQQTMCLSGLNHAENADFKSPAVRGLQSRPAQ